MPTSEFKKDDRVVYVNGEIGTVSFLNERYVFVKFDKDMPVEYGKACYPDTLTLILDEMVKQNQQNGLYDGQEGEAAVTKAI